MTPPLFTALANQRLDWTQTHTFGHQYELHAGDTRLGALVFRSGFGTFATVENAHGCWTMKRVGFLRTRVEIRPCDRETAVGTFHNSTWSGGGTLEIPGGRPIRANINFWQTKCEFVDADDRPLIRYTSGGFLKASGSMEITEVGAATPEVGWMAMLGWYLILMMRRDAAIAAS